MDIPKIIEAHNTLRDAENQIISAAEHYQKLLREVATSGTYYYRQAWYRITPLEFDEMDEDAITITLRDSEWDAESLVLPWSFITGNDTERKAWFDNCHKHLIEAAERRRMERRSNEQIHERAELRRLAKSHPDLISDLAKEN